MKGLVFKSDPYDEQTVRILRDIIDSIGDNHGVTCGHVEDDHTIYRTLRIFRPDIPKAIPGITPVRQIIDAIEEMARLSFQLVATPSVRYDGSWDYYWTNDLEPFEPSPEEKVDPFEEPPPSKSEVNPAAVARWRRATGDDDLIPDEDGGVKGPPQDH